MTTEILKDFLLFEVTELESVAHFLDQYALILIPGFLVCELIQTKFRENPDLKQSIRRLLIVQFLIIFLPSFFNPIATIGFTIGDELINAKVQTSKAGIISNWVKIKSEMEKELKKKKKPKEGTKASLAVVLYNLLAFSETDVVSKGATLLLMIIMILLKVLYSAVFYGTYVMISFRALLAIDQSYERNLEGIKTSILYLALVPVIVSSILVLTNDRFDIQVSESGFIESLASIAYFIVLGILLFASLKIAKSILDGAGFENWGASTGQFLSAGLGYNALTKGSSFSLSKGAAIASGGASLVAGSAITKGAVGMALSPFKQMFSGAKNGAGNFFSDLKRDGSIESQYNNPYISGHSSSNGSSAPLQRDRQNVVEGRYSEAFSAVTGKDQGQLRIRDAINPSNHLKAMGNATKGAYNSSVNNFQRSLGLPINSQNLSVKQKIGYVGDKVFNSSRPNANSLSAKDQIKNNLIANQISKRLEK
jgi:hypothetical protein